METHHYFPGWILRLVIGFAICVMVVWMMLPFAQRHFPWVENKSAWGQFFNSSIAEGYVQQPQDYQVIITGSSVSTMLPPLGHEKPGVYTLPMQGSSALTGLRLVNCTQARPKLVLVEVDVISRGWDESLIEDVCDPATLVLKGLLPTLSYRYNLVAMLGRRGINRMPPAPIRPQTMTPAQWRKHIGDKVKHYRNSPSPGREGIQENIDRLRQQVEQLQEKGIKVVFFQVPFDIDLANKPSMKMLRQMVAEEFPDIRVIHPPKNRFFYMIDGLHFTDYSGLSYYHYLLEQVRSDIAYPN